jgi:hypothetical protein
MYDIIFISNNEPNAYENWQILSTRFVAAKKVSNIKGIHQSHITAAKNSYTKMFWVVDGDARILDTFNFDYEVPNYDQDIVHIFNSINPINDLVYGYGAVKLLPRKLTSQMPKDTLDMTLGISNKIKIINQISNITHFNVDEFSTWRSGFREGVKLTLNVLKKHDNDESLKRLNSWCEIGLDKPFGEYCIQGAREGKNYALVNFENMDALKLINNFDWLKARFEYA